jgi:DNA repair protein RecO (recombination protein O)
MIAKTEAIVLRVVPYSNSSHIVTWLTPDQGKLSTMIKGAMRPKSMFLGQYDLFYTCELLYYRKEYNGLHIAKECSPINTRSELRSDWRSAACASYISDMMQRVSYRGGHQPELYQLTKVALDSLTQQKSKTQFMFWFELHLANLLGIKPQFENCTSCKADIVASKQTRISFSHGGLICERCAGIEAGHGTHTASIGADIVSMIKSWQAADTPKSLQNVHCSTNQLLALRDILGTFISFHLEMNPKSRSKAFEIMEQRK